MRGFHKVTLPARSTLLVQGSAFPGNGPDLRPYYADDAEWTMGGPSLLAHDLIDHGGDAGVCGMEAMRYNPAYCEAFAVGVAWAGRVQYGDRRYDGRDLAADLETLADAPEDAARPAPAWLIPARAGIRSLEDESMESMLRESFRDARRDVLDNGGCDLHPDLMRAFRLGHRAELRRQRRLGYWGARAYAWYRRAADLLASLDRYLTYLAVAYVDRSIGHVGVWHPDDGRPPSWARRALEECTDGRILLGELADAGY